MTNYTHGKLAWALLILPIMAIGFVCNIFASSFYVGWSLGNALCDRVWNTSMDADSVALAKAYMRIREEKRQ